MAKAISIELGGSHAVIALLEEQTILGKEELPIALGQDLGPLLPRLAEHVRSLLAQFQLKASDTLGIALSVAAMVDADCRRVVSTNGKYPDAGALDLPAWSLQTFGLPLAVENDTRMALLGEWYAGAARGFDSVVLVTLGTGIGGAVMVHGKPLRTARPQGGCLGGHLPVNMNGRLCSCGAIGCMEAEASTWALPLILRDWPGIETSALAGDLDGGFRQLFSHADAGDEVARQVRDHCIRVWAVGTVGLIHAYGPELVLFGGGVMRSGECVLDGVRRYVERHAWQPAGPAILRSATLGPDAALYGAVPFLLQQQISD